MRKSREINVNGMTVKIPTNRPAMRENQYIEISNYTNNGRYIVIEGQSIYVNTGSTMKISVNGLLNAKSQLVINGITYTFSLVNGLDLFDSDLMITPRKLYGNGNSLTIWKQGEWFVNESRKLGLNFVILNENDTVYYNEVIENESLGHPFTPEFTAPFGIGNDINQILITEVLPLDCNKKYVKIRYTNKYGYDVEIWCEILNKKVENTKEYSVVSDLNGVKTIKNRVESIFLKFSQCNESDVLFYSDILTANKLEVYEENSGIWIPATSTTKSVVTPTVSEREIDLIFEINTKKYDGNIN